MAASRDLDPLNDANDLLAAHNLMRPTIEPITTDTWTPLPESPQARALAHVTQLSEGPPIDASLRVTLHFHPDRLRGDVPILAALAADGLYHSQFETGISNGWLDSTPGGGAISGSRPW